VRHGVKNLYVPCTPKKPVTSKSKTQKKKERKKKKRKKEKKLTGFVFGVLQRTTPKTKKRRGKDGQKR